MIGRDRELGIAEHALARVSQGAGEILLLVGEAGVGKSHLLGGIVQRARQRGFDVAIGRCFADAVLGPFGPFREALSGDVFAAPTARRRLSEERARSFERVLRALSARCAAGPVLLAIEDLHWADRESLALFQHVARFGMAQALLLAGTLRAPDIDAHKQPALDDLLAELVREPRCQRLALAPLSMGEAAELCAELACAPMPQALVTTLHAETSGNALYLRELVRYLLEARKISLKAGRVATDLAASELGLPPSIRDVVRQRVSRLSPPAIGLLRCAAVAGTPLDTKPLFEVAGLQTADALDEALGSGLLRSTGAGCELAHAIVRRAIYEELNPSRRAQLHRQLAQALQSAAPERHAEIAAHYHASRALAGAEAGVDHALAAAELARSTGAHERAVEQLTLARELTPPGAQGTLADIAHRLAITLAEGLDVPRALAATDVACQLLAAAGEADAITELLSVVAGALEAGGVPVACWEGLVERGLALASSQRGLSWARLALLARRPHKLIDGPVWVARFAGEGAEAVALLRAQGGEHDFAASVDAHELRTPEQTAELIARARTFQDAAARARILDACARDVFFRGRDFHGAAALVRELGMLSERAASLAGEVSARIVLCCCLAALGEFSEAAGALARARELAIRLGSMHRMNAVGPGAAEASLGYFVGADWDALATRFLSFVGSPRAAETPFGIVPLSLGLLALAQAGRAERAAALFPLHLRALELLPQAMNEWGAGRDCGASALWALGSAEHAASYLALAERADERTCCACWSVAPHSAARMLALSGEVARSRAQFERARREFADSGRAPSLAICDYDEALTLTRAEGALGPAARALAEAALRKFQELEMAPWTRAAQALLAPDARPDGLSERELEVLRLLAAGMSNKELAAKLFVSVATIERHISNVYTKIGAQGRADATRYALRKGLLG